MSKTSRTIWVSVCSSLIVALIVGIIAYMVTVKVNQIKIQIINENVEKIHTSLTNIQNGLVDSQIRFKNIEEKNNEFRKSLKDTRKSLNKLILALVSNNKLGLDYKQFTSFNSIDNLQFDALVKLGNEIKKTRKKINNIKNITSEKKYVVIEEFFNDISDVYKANEGEKAFVARNLFNFQWWGTGGSLEE